jgi:hypothetical protein
VCATVGAGVGRITVEGHHALLALVVAALGAGQALGHITLTAIGMHHHVGSALVNPLHMVAMHAIAAVVLGLLIGAVEYLFLVCSSVLSWLRLFAAAALGPATVSVCRCSNVVVVQPVLLRAGLGMRARNVGQPAARHGRWAEHRYGARCATPHPQR